MEPTKRPKPGLKSIHDAREQRRPGGKYARPSTAVYLVGVGAILASLVVYRYVSSYQLDSGKRDLLAKQRAAASTIGSEWFPLRDGIERRTLGAAAAFEGDKVDPEAAHWHFKSSPGIYLRLRVADAMDADRLHEALMESQKDAFTSCLLREPNQPATRGDADAGAFSEQPWNLRQAYLATRVLTPAFTEDVKAAEDEMRMRVLDGEYEKAVKTGIPMTADLVKRAQFFLLVLDEDVDEAKATADGGPVREEDLQLVAHPSRVHIVNLKTNTELVRVRRTGAASFVFAGEHVVTDPETRDALQRQVNNCSLADQVRAAIAEATSPSHAGETTARERSSAPTVDAGVKRGAKVP